MVGLLEAELSQSFASWNVVNCCTAVHNVLFEKVCNNWSSDLQAFKVTQSRKNCRCMIGHMSRPLSVGNDIVEPVSSVRDFGIHLDADLITMRTMLRVYVE